MKKEERNICKIFLAIDTPRDFLNNTEKLMINEYFKGICDTILSNKKVDIEAYKIMLEQKKYLSENISFKNNDNVIYFDLLRLFMSVVKKYIDVF